MTFNQLNLKKTTSGRSSHRYLIKEAYRILSREGYEVKIEYILKNKKKADLFAIKGKDEIIVECLVRPSLSIVKKKRENYKNKYLIIVYPFDFIPTFPIEDFCERIIKVDLPEEIKNKERKILIQISDELWEDLNKMKTCNEKTFEEVLRRLIKEKKK